MPYHFANGTRAIQRFDRAAADAMVEFHNSALGKLVRLFQGLPDGRRGIPLFAGHPDSNDTEIARRAPDKRVHGQFTALEARADGLYGQLTPEASGKELVNSRQLIKLSPRWFSTETPIGMENGVPIYRPVALASVGLTNRPNIQNAPTLPFLNEEHNQGGQLMNHELLKKLLALLGFENEAPNAGDKELKPELVAKISTGLQTLADKVGQVATLTTELANEKTAKTELQTKLTKLQEEKDTAVKEFNNERTAHIGALLAAAIKDGRLTAADQPAWERRLKADFANEAAELGKLTAKVKTQSATTAAGKRTANGSGDGVSAIVELVNEELAKLPAGTKNGWDLAFQAASKKHPEVFNKTQPTE